MFPQNAPGFHSGLFLLTSITAFGVPIGHPDVTLVGVRRSTILGLLVGRAIYFRRGTASTVLLLVDRFRCDVFANVIGYGCLFDIVFSLTLSFV